MKKIAFIIPIYINDFKFLYNIRDKIKCLNCFYDFYLIFSSQSELDSFQDKALYKCLIYDHDAIRFGKFEANPAGYKKFWALEHLNKTKDYDYYICPDAEIDFLLDNSNYEKVLSKVENFYRHKKIFGGKLEPHTKWERSINRGTRSFLGDEVSEYIKDKVGDDYWYWWSDLPVFRSDHLVDFLNKIRYYEKKFVLEFCHFDHNLYLGYLLYYHDFVFEKLTEKYSEFKKLIWSLEFYNPHDTKLLKKLINLNYGFSYVNNIVYKENSEFYEKQGTFIIYHLDRTNTKTALSKIKY